MRKDSKWTGAGVAITGLAMVVLIAGMVVYVSQRRQPSNDILTRQSPSTSEQSTGQGTPTYSSDCQPQAGCTAPQNQSQGQGVPPTQGTITAVSGSSLSVRPSDGSAIKTFKVTSGAKVMKSTASSDYNANDLKIGQAITVVPMLSDSTTVEYIALDNTGRLNNVNE